MHDGGWRACGEGQQRGQHACVGWCCPHDGHPGIGPGGGERPLPSMPGSDPSLWSTRFCAQDPLTSQDGGWCRSQRAAFVKSALRGGQASLDRLLRVGRREQRRCFDARGMYQRSDKLGEEGKLTLVCVASYSSTPSSSSLRYLELMDMSRSKEGSGLPIFRPVSGLLLRPQTVGARYQFLLSPSSTPLFAPPIIIPKKDPEDDFESPSSF